MLCFMFNIIKNSKNIFIFQLSIFLVSIIFHWPLCITNLIMGFLHLSMEEFSPFMEGIPFILPFTLYLTPFVYIYIYKKTILQLNLLIILTSKLVIKYYNLTKKMYPDTRLVVFFFFVSILYLLKIIVIFYKFQIVLYIYYSLNLFLNFVIIFLFAYEFLFNPQIPALLYQYLEIIIETNNKNKNNKNYEKIRLKIIELLDKI